MENKTKQIKKIFHGRQDIKTFVKFAKEVMVPGDTLNIDTANLKIQAKATHRLFGEDSYTRIEFFYNEYYLTWVYDHQANLWLTPKYGVNFGGNKMEEKNAHELWSEEQLEEWKAENEISLMLEEHYKGGN